MPPLFEELLEAVVRHHSSQKVSLFQAVVKDKLSVLVRRLPEEVKVAAHKLTPVVQVPNRYSVSQYRVVDYNVVNFSVEANNGEVDSTASCVSRFSSNVARWDNILLLNEWEKELLH